jgi:hypothetical protein
MKCLYFFKRTADNLCPSFFKGTAEKLFLDGYECSNYGQISSHTLMCKYTVSSFAVPETKPVTLFIPEL